MNPSAGALCASRFRSCEINPKIIKKSAPPQQKNFPRGPHPLLTLRLLSRLFFCSGPGASAEAFAAKRRLGFRFSPLRASGGAFGLPVPFTVVCLFVPAPELQLRWRRLLRGKAAPRLSLFASPRLRGRLRSCRAFCRGLFLCPGPELQLRPHCAMRIEKRALYL